MAIDVAQSLRQVVAETAGDEALAFAGTWRSWDWMRAFCGAADSAAGTARNVALVARNRPHHVAVMASNLAARRSTTMLHAVQSADALARNIRALTCSTIFSDEQDWSPQALGAAADIGTSALAIEDRPGRRARPFWAISGLMLSALNGWAAAKIATFRQRGVI